jgi:hypothetical protein
MQRATPHRIALYVIAGLMFLRVAVAIDSVIGILLLVAVMLGILFWTVLGSLPK